MRFGLFGLLVLSIFSSLFAWAGRETHGIVPGKFHCSGESKAGTLIKIEFSFPTLANPTTRTVLILDHQLTDSFVCEDRGEYTGSDWQQTILCEKPESVFAIRILERNHEAKAQIWETSVFGRKPSMVWEIPCH